MKFLVILILICFTAGVMSRTVRQERQLSPFEVKKKRVYKDVKS